MAEFIDSLSIVQLIFITYFMRICDVSLNTIKTISVVQGRIAMAVVLGFFEVLIWVTVVSQVITRLGDYPILGVAYAAGYATGNAVGIVIDRFRFWYAKDGERHQCVRSRFRSENGSMEFQTP